MLCGPGLVPGRKGVLPHASPHVTRHWHSWIPSLQEVQRLNYIVEVGERLTVKIVLPAIVQ